jgi:hypothetical protein
MTVTNQNMIHEEVKSRINLGNRIFFSSHLLPKNVKITIHKTTIVPVSM